MEPRIRRAAIVVTLGLVAALISLVINHPLAFLGFIAPGVFLVLAGITLYLIALLRRDAPGSNDRPFQ